MSNPSLYITDVSIRIVVREEKRLNTRVKRTSTIITKKLKSHPVLLLDGDFPSDKYKERFILKNCGVDLKLYSNPTVEVVFGNVKFSSKINYQFNEY